MELKQYVLEQLVRESAANETVIQELLTCVYFDCWFNRNIKDENPIGLRDRVFEEASQVMDALGNSVGRGFSEGARDLVDFENAKKPGDRQKKKDWMLSFWCQCKSFENWLSENPGFTSHFGSKPIAFVHHDTKIGVCKGDVSHEWSQVVNRVDRGYKEYRLRDKDTYQKADIYAVLDDSDSASPYEDPIEEITYWANAAMGKSEDAFVGISLKKITRPLTNVHMFNLTETEEVFDASEIEFDVEPFEDVRFNSPEDFSVGKITSTIKFDLKWLGNDQKKIVSLRSNGFGDSHIDKSAMSFFHPASTVELSSVGMKAAEGKVVSRVNRMAEMIGRKTEKDPAVYTASELSVQIVELKNLCSRFGIELSLNMTEDSKNLITFLYDNDQKIREMFTAWDKRKEGDRRTVQMYADGVKWKAIVLKQIEYLLAICHYAQNITEEHRRNGEQMSYEGGMFITLFELVKAAKGINVKGDFTHLPYVFLG